MLSFSFYVYVSRTAGTKVVFSYILIVFQSGAFTFVPFFFQIFSKFIAGFIVDWLKKSKGKAISFTFNFEKKPDLLISAGLGHTTAAKWCQSIGENDSFKKTIHMISNLTFLSLFDMKITLKIIQCKKYCVL